MSSESFACSVSHQLLTIVKVFANQKLRNVIVLHWTSHGSVHLILCCWYLTLFSHSSILLGRCVNSGKRWLKIKTWRVTPLNICWICCREHLYTTNKRIQEKSLKPYAQQLRCLLLYVIFIISFAQHVPVKNLYAAMIVVSQTRRSLYKMQILTKYDNFTLLHSVWFTTISICNMLIIAPCLNESHLWHFLSRRIEIYWTEKLWR